MKQSDFRPDIQGLRAIAVLAVLIFHAFPSTLTGGFVGVDVFFVISGYLISRIIIADVERGNFSFRSFYARRIKRIFPALVVVMAATFVVGSLVLSPSALKELGRNSVSTMLFVSNIDQFLLGGYFDGAAEFRPLLHTWSLAVEEQFYILYPVVLLWILRGSRVKGAIVLSILAALSLLVAHLTLRISTVGGFYLTIGRCFELLIGCILALQPVTQLSSRARGVISVCGLLCISAAITLYTSETIFPGAAALLPCMGAAMVILAGESSPSVGGRAISSKFFRYFGDRSYSLYLWHWPVLAFARNVFGLDLTWGIAGIAVAVSACLSHLSFQYIERPALKLDWADWRVLQRGAACGVTVIVCGVILVLTQGVPQRFGGAALEAFRYEKDFTAERSRCHNGDRPALSYSQNCVFGADGAGPETAVWGDSHAAELAVALGAEARGRSSAILQISASACPPNIDLKVRDRPRCASFGRETLASLSKDGRIKQVVLIANADNYPNQRELQQNYANVIRELSLTKRVIIVAQIPIMDFDPPAAVGQFIAWRQDISGLGKPRKLHDDASRPWNSWIAGLQAPGRVEFFDPAGVLCDRELCRASSKEGTPLYFNRTHLGTVGSKMLASALAKEIWR